MFGIWINGPGIEWEQFKKALDTFGHLKWVCSELKDSVLFLDLTLSINKHGIIEKTTYIKPNTLHVYIPAMSTHPSGSFKGTIFGNLLHCRNQNFNIADCRTLIQAFSTHLQARGHDVTEIEATMLEAAAHIENKSNNKSNDKTIRQDTLTSTLKTLFIHWQYHPFNIYRTVLRRLYSGKMEGFDGFDAMAVCYSIHKKMRGVLTNTVLDQPLDEKMSKILNNMKNTNPYGKTELLVP
jgi:hypothetical protein